MAKKAVVILSGGMDSTTLLYDTVDRLGEDKVCAISVNYGQRHSIELSYAIDTCEYLQVEHKVVDLSGLRAILGGSALTSSYIDVPEGHYEDETMKETVVPNRNMILISIAAGYAVSVGATELYIGAHSGDHAIYPDCRREFLESMAEPLLLANYTPIELFAPYWDLNKADIATIGMTLDIDYVTSYTCYNGGKKPCGKCGSCQERIEAIQLSGAIDSTEYAA